VREKIEKFPLLGADGIVMGVFWKRGRDVFVPSPREEVRRLEQAGAISIHSTEAET